MREEMNPQTAYNWSVGLPEAEPAAVFAGQPKKKKKSDKLRIVGAIVLCLLMMSGFALSGTLWMAAGNMMAERGYSHRVEPDIPDKDDREEQREPAAQEQDENETVKQDPKRHLSGNIEKFALSDIPMGEEGAPAAALSAEEITQKVKPGVVGVYAFDEDDWLYSEGSGVILKQNGFIVTNEHVVSDAYGLEVRLDNGRLYEAEIVGTDVDSDLAVIKIEETGLSVPEYGNSDQVAIGSMAVAIGNSSGFHNSVTQGIFSGKNRQIDMRMDDGSTYRYTLLQTDAAINPGNSGGAVVNKFGQVVGISSSKIASVDYEGMGFAIPTQLMKPVVEDLMAYGEVRSHARLGVMVAAITESPKGKNAPKTGVVIAEITENGSMAGTNAKVGDIITEADGAGIIMPEDLIARVERRRAGEKMTLKIYRTEQDTYETVTVILKDAAD